MRYSTDSAMQELAICKSLATRNLFLCGSTNFSHKFSVSCDSGHHLCAVEWIKMCLKHNSKQGAVR